MPVFKAILEYSTGMSGWLFEPFLVVLKTRPSSWGRREANSLHAKAEQRDLEDVLPSTKTLASVPTFTHPLCFFKCPPPTYHLLSDHRTSEVKAAALPDTGFYLENFAGQAAATPFFDAGHNTVRKKML